LIIRNIFNKDFILEKRQRKPLAIIDPKSHVAIKVETTTSPTTTEDSTTDSTTSNSKSTDDAKKNQKQADFRKDFARILNPNVQTDKVDKIFSIIFLNMFCSL
jgi:hypothetical protein